MIPNILSVIETERTELLSNEVIYLSHKKREVQNAYEIIRLVPDRISMSIYYKALFTQIEVDLNPHQWEDQPLY